jgi:flagellar motor switch protein FliN
MAHDDLMTKGAADLRRLYDVPVELAVEIGRVTMTIRETLDLTPGSIVALNRLAGEPVDLLVNGRPLARGEVVVIDEEFGLRITEILDRTDEDEAPPLRAEHAMTAEPAPLDAPFDELPAALEPPPSPLEGGEPAAHVVL